MVLLGFEPRIQDSESWVLTTTLQDQWRRASPNFPTDIYTCNAQPNSGRDRHVCCSLAIGNRRPRPTKQRRASPLSRCVPLPICAQQTKSSADRETRDLIVNTRGWSAESRKRHNRGWTRVRKFGEVCCGSIWQGARRGRAFAWSSWL